MAPEIKHSSQGGMVVPVLSHLHKKDASGKMINHLLVASGLPPFDGEIEFSACCHEPEGTSANFLHPGKGGFLLLLGEMDVSFELARQNTNAEPFTQIFNEPVDEMVGALVALVNQRVVAGQHLGFRVILSEGVRCGLCNHRSGHEVLTSVRKSPGKVACRSRTAAVSITMCPGL